MTPGVSVITHAPEPTLEKSLDFTYLGVYLQMLSHKLCKYPD